MAFVIIFVLAFILAFVLQFTVKCQWVSITVPVVCFVGFVLFDAYVLPYRGGGASMWPIAIIFGVPVVVAGGLLGVNVGRRFIKPRQGGKKCVLTLCSCRRRGQRATFSIASGAGAAQQNVRHPMQKYNCPKCGQASFSFWQKQFLGPLGSIPCGACGASVSVPWGKSIAWDQWGQTRLIQKSAFDTLRLNIEPGTPNGPPAALCLTRPAATCDPARQQPPEDLPRRRRLPVLSRQTPRRCSKARLHRPRLCPDDQSRAPAGHPTERERHRRHDANARTLLCSALQLLLPAQRHALGRALQGHPYRYRTLSAWLHALY